MKVKTTKLLKFDVNDDFDINEYLAKYEGEVAALTWVAELKTFVAAVKAFHPISGGTDGEKKT